MQDINQMRRKLLHNRFFLLLIPKILPLEPINSKTLLTHKQLTKLNPLKLWMNLFPKVIILHLFLIILINQANPIFRLHRCIFLLHHSCNLLRPFIQLFRNFNRTIHKQFLFLLILLLLVSVIRPCEFH